MATNLIFFSCQLLVEIYSSREQERLGRRFFIWLCTVLQRWSHAFMLIRAAMCRPIQSCTSWNLEVHYLGSCWRNRTLFFFQAIQSQFSPHLGDQGTIVVSEHPKRTKRVNDAAGYNAIAIVLAQIDQANQNRGECRTSYPAVRLTRTGAKAGQVIRQCCVQPAD